MYKRRPALLLLCAALLSALFAGCGGAAKSPADDTYHPETDYQYWLNQNSVYHNVAETKEGLYIDTPQALPGILPELYARCTNKN